MKVIVGLGNPGRRYANTRHNLGFRVVDCLSERWGIAVDRKRHHGLIGTGHVNGEKVVLVKPMTYVNRSGLCVRQVVRYTLDRLDDLLVVVDDIHLPLGVLRLRPRGSSGGHNGLKSICRDLGTDEFPRIRIGIGRPAEQAEEMTGHVLGKFRKKEAPAVDEAIERAADAVYYLMRNGFDAAMNEFN